MVTRPTAMAPDASTSPVEWGPEIRVDGKRPEWLTDNIVVAWCYKSGQVEAKCRSGSLDFATGMSWQVNFIRLPADHPYYSKAPTTPEIDPALRDRMVRAIHAYAGASPALITTGRSIWAEMQSLSADLPKPVDPDLLLARQCVIETLKPEDHRRCNCREKITAGEWDNGHKVRIARAALAKARGTSPAPEVSHVG